MEQTFPLPQKSASPLVVRYDPQLRVEGEDFFNPVLGYPRCPMLGRYNKGEYKLPETAAHISFDCYYGEKGYQCGPTVINIPALIVEALQEIPEVIPHNKSVSQEKNTKILDFHPIHFPVMKRLTFKWVISFGQVGKDFLNYINHTHIFGQEIIMDQKLKRNVHLLPIMAHFPPGSGLQTEQVERGLSVDRLRSEYMSIHLKFGAPAFSPNNMRLGVEGMPKVTSQRQPNQQGKQKQGNKKQGKYKPKYIEKHIAQQNRMKQEKQECEKEEEQTEQPKCSITTEFEKTKTSECNEQQQQKIKEQKPQKQEPEEQKQKTQKADMIDIDWEKLEAQNPKVADVHKEKAQRDHDKDIQQGEKKRHQGFLHFYSTILLEDDYRVYYHWHIEDPFRQQCLRELLKRSKTLESLLDEYSAFSGADPMAQELKRVFGWL